MWYHWPFVLSFLAPVLLTNFVMAAVHWDEMWVKHTWNDIPVNWESLGNPDAREMIDLHIALIPEQEGALTDALSEISDPMHPRDVYLATPPRAYTHVRRCVSDMAHTLRRNKLPSLSGRPKKLSISFVPGLYTTTYDLPPSHLHTAAPG